MQTLRDAARAARTGNNKNKTKHNNNNNNKNKNNNNNNNNNKHCYTRLSQETRKIPNTKSNSTPKELEAGQQRHTKASRKRKIIKITAEINNTESKGKQ